MIAARIQANQRGRARAYHVQRYYSGTNAGAAWSLQRPRTTYLRGGSPVEPWRCPVQFPCQHNSQYTRYPAWCLFAYLGWLSQMAFLCTCTQNFYRYFPPGCGRSWPERPERQWCHQVCCRPPRRVEKASLMSLPGAPELKKVNAGQNVFLDLYTFLVPARNQPLVHHVRLSPLVSAWKPRLHF